MRFNEFKIVEAKLREANEVYVIGDSHAVAMGGSNNLAANGARLSAIARQAQRVPEGATVYMTGGHNDVTAGTSPQQIASQVQSIISSLDGKGCTVNYILFPEGTDNNNQENMAPTREAISSAVTVAQDLDGCSMQPDGIHCSLGSYRGIVRAPTQERTAGPDSFSNAKPEELDSISSAEPEELDSISNAEPTTLTSGPPYPREEMDAVKAMQKDLEELGYTVGSTGVDGKYGPRTTRAVRAFKKDYNLQGDGRTFDAAAKDIIAKIKSGSITRVEPTQIQLGSDGLEYPISNNEIESIITREAEARGIVPSVAIAVYRAEGRSSYQSTVPRSGKGSLNGREASFGPYQLYIGGGLGNDYQDRTGRDLISDNTPDGITNQIRFALDAAVSQGWTPWYGAKNVGISRWEGLQGARRARNWS